MRKMYWVLPGSEWTPEEMADWVEERHEGIQMTSQVQFYPHRYMGMARHFMWVLGVEGGEKDNFTKTDTLIQDVMCKSDREYYWVYGTHVTFSAERCIRGSQWMQGYYDESQ